MQRRIVTSLALALCLVCCGSKRGEQVPLLTVATPVPGGCVLMHQVVDVIADPRFGTAIQGTNTPLRWTWGHTAWRVGSEVQVLDSAGRAVLTTGGRYWLCPANDGNYSKPLSEWVIGEIRPCPTCELGFGID